MIYRLFYIEYILWKSVNLRLKKKCMEYMSVFLWMYVYRSCSFKSKFLNVIYK